MKVTKAMRKAVKRDVRLVNIGSVAYTECVCGAPMTDHKYIGRGYINGRNVYIYQCPDGLLTKLEV